MRIPKRYGESRIDNCPFCGKICVTKNKQGVPVCQGHKDSELENLKCVCGGWLDVKAGKWGAYFFCMNCGNISYRKGIDMNPQISKDMEVKEIEVTSDQLDYLY